MGNSGEKNAPLFGFALCLPKYQIPPLQIYTFPKSAIVTLSVEHAYKKLDFPNRNAYSKWRSVALTALGDESEILVGDEGEGG